MEKKLIHVSFLFLVMFFVFSCHRAEPLPESWDKFTFPEYQGFVYSAQMNEKVYLVLCGNFAGIEASLKINHACTVGQYEIFKEKVVEAGSEKIGQVPAPETEGYPDLSVYITFVFSSDELHDLWAQFGLEESLQD